MKLLVIIVSHDMDIKYLDNIRIFDEYFREEGRTVDYAAISSTDDFSIYESVIPLKYKMINPLKQVSKLFDFITTYRDTLDYDWYIKIRPDVKLLEPIDFSIPLRDAINARARLYRGPKRVKYGMPVGGEGGWSSIRDGHYSEQETLVILDDHIVIFHNDVVNRDVFQSMNLDRYRHDETLQSNIWRSRGMTLNVMGINAKFCKYGDSTSGDLNM